MFDFIRSNIRLLQIMLLVLIVPSFVFFGVQGYTQFREEGNQDVAKVDGLGIKQAEWDAAHQRRVAQLREQMPDVDAKLFDGAEARTATLNILIRDRVLATAAQSLHLVVPDNRLQRLFVTDPQFAPLRNADGSINKVVIGAEGMTSEIFESRLRHDLALQQVLNGVGKSVLPPTAAVEASVGAMLQRREIRFARFDIKDYLARTQPTAADVEAYYKAHEAAFRLPEQASIEYVVLDLDVVKKGISVAEQDLRKYYEENISRFSVAEERDARHILIKVDKDAAPDIRQKAKAKAESLLAEARRNPAAFADLAMKNSQDEGSAAQGGELGFFGRGAMVKPFEDAVYALKPGEISPLIESDFGYHVIKLESIRGGERKAFEAVRGNIEDDVRRQLATRRWAEAAELFTNTVFEQSDSLNPVVDKLKLERRTATVQRDPRPDAKGALASSKLFEAIFSGDTVKNKRNTIAVEVAPNQLASARIVTHQPARTLTLAEAKDRATALVQAEQAAALARTESQKRLTALKGGTQGELPGHATISRMKPEGLDPKTVETILAADATQLPAFLAVTAAGQGDLVVRIDKVLPPDLPAQQAAGVTAQYAQALAQAESYASFQALRARFKVETLGKGAAAAASAVAQ